MMILKVKKQKFSCPATPASLQSQFLARMARRTKHGYDTGRGKKRRENHLRVGRVIPHGIISMQKWTGSSFSSPLSSSSSSTASTGATFYWGIHFSNMVQKNEIWPVKQHMRHVSINIISESSFSALKSDPWSWTHGQPFLSDVSIPGWSDMAWLCSSMQCTGILESMAL